MAINYIKKYSSLLEINHFTEYQRRQSLRAIFDRDIADNDNFNFRNKIIRPLKKEGMIDVESLFKHLTHRSEDEKNNHGKTIKKRDYFDFERSKRLHWITPHINERINDIVLIFSSNNRIRSRNIPRTYIYNKTKKYVIILEPQRSKLDYYFITAYYLEDKYGGISSIETKYKNRFREVY
jgi:hypothetical protein